MGRPFWIKIRLLLKIQEPAGEYKARLVGEEWTGQGAVSVQEALEGSLKRWDGTSLWRPLRESLRVDLFPGSEQSRPNTDLLLPWPPGIWQVSHVQEALA